MRYQKGRATIWIQGRAEFEDAKAIYARVSAASKTHLNHFGSTEAQRLWSAAAGGIGDLYAVDVERN